MSELAADNIPVAVSLRVLKLSRQPYYRWRHQQVTTAELTEAYRCLLYTSPSPRDRQKSRMPSSA